MLREGDVIEYRTGNGTIRRGTIVKLEDSTTVVVKFHGGQPHAGQTGFAYTDQIVKCNGREYHE